MVHTESEMNSSGAVSGMKLNVGVFYISRSIFRILRKGEAGPKFFVQIIHFWPVSSSRVALGRAEKWLWSILVILVPIALFTGLSHAKAAPVKRSEMSYVDENAFLSPEPPVRLGRRGLGKRKSWLWSFGDLS